MRKPKDAGCELFGTIRIMTEKEAEKWAIEEAKRITISVLKGHSIKTCLFGSRATGNARRFSDIDIALDAGGKPVPIALMVRLMSLLEESHIPFRVDLVDMQGVSAFVKESVKKEGQLWID